jgi:hypothetical protein
MRIQSWNYLDTVEVIGSIPVAPIDVSVLSAASPRSFLLGADRVRIYYFLAPSDACWICLEW